MLRKLTLTVLSVCSLLMTAKAQDPEYSQFYAAPLYLNPAFAGSAGGPRVIANYRNQWPGINDAYKNYAISYDQSISSLSSGIGIMITADDQGNGIYKTTNVALNYAYQIQVNDVVSISAGLQGYYSQRTLNTNDLIFRLGTDGNADPNGSGEPLTGQKTLNSYDFAAGFLIFSKTFFGGFAVDHLNEPNVSFYEGKEYTITDAQGNVKKDNYDPSKIYKKYTGHIGATIPLGDIRSNSSISPNFLYQRQGSFNQLNAGLYYNRGPFVLGGWYRYAFTNGDAFIALIGIKQGKFKAGYSYDLTTSKLRTASAGAHEISVALEFEPSPKAKRRSYKKINCPAF